MAVFKRNALIEKLGLDVPIVQAPMAGVQGNELAVAVSNAGGLGSLPCAMLSIEAMQSELKLIQQNTTKAFSVNFFCHKPPEESLQRHTHWLNALSPYCKELGIDPSSIAIDASRVPFNSAIADALEPFKPAVVSFHFGLPEASLVARVKSWGSLVISSATTLKEARWLEANGVDAVIAQGLEAGGHRGVFMEPMDEHAQYLNSQMGTAALLPQVVNAVQVPVIAAGGISTAEGVKAALDMGAAAVQMGTGFLLCDETKTSALHRQAIECAAKGESYTALTNVFSGRPARSVVNRIMLEQGPMSRDTPDFPLAASAAAALKVKAEANNSSEFSSLWCGQNPSGCKAQPASDYVNSLANQLNAVGV